MNLKVAIVSNSVSCENKCLKMITFLVAQKSHQKFSVQLKLCENALFILKNFFLISTQTQEHFQRRVHGFEIGMKLEVVHPLKPSIICPATVTKSLGPYYFAITTDYQEDVSSVTFCCHADSPGIFPAGWSRRHQVELAVPASQLQHFFWFSLFVLVSPTMCFWCC